MNNLNKLAKSSYSKKETAEAIGDFDEKKC